MPGPILISRIPSIIALFKAGLKNQEVAEKSGVSYLTIWSWYKKGKNNEGKDYVEFYESVKDYWGKPGRPKGYKFAEANLAKKAILADGNSNGNNNTNLSNNSLPASVREEGQAEGGTASEILPAPVRKPSNLVGAVRPGSFPPLLKKASRRVKTGPKKPAEKLDSPPKTVYYDDTEPEVEGLENWEEEQFSDSDIEKQLLKEFGY